MIYNSFMNIPHSPTMGQSIPSFFGDGLFYFDGILGRDVPKLCFRLATGQKRMPSFLFYPVSRGTVGLITVGSGLEW